MAPPSTLRILLVDDSQLVRTLIKERLSKLDPFWEITEAKSGVEALLQTSASRPDIAMLDLSLPDMLGETLAGRIRQLSPITKIVLCSLSDKRLLAQVAEHVQADGFISKTASTDEFRATFTALIHARPTSSGIA
jgi:DNA-binding NarL/FixJ family response regulator